MENNGLDNKSFASELLSKLKADLIGNENESESDIADGETVLTDNMFDTDAAISDVDEEYSDAPEDLISKVLSESKDSDFENENFGINGKNDGDSLEYTDDEYAAPDEELYSTLSAGGKVCDIPEDYSSHNEADTKDAPLRKGATLLYDVFKSDTETDDDDIVDISQLRQELGISHNDSETENDNLAVYSDGDTVSFDNVYRNSTLTNDEIYRGDETDTDIELSRIYEESSSDEIGPNGETIRFDSVSEADVSDEAHDAPADDGEDLSSGDEMALCPADTTEDMADIAEFDETDANLMIAFGLEDELNQAIGKDNAEKLISENENSADEQNNAKPAEDVGYKEYISPAETKDIFDDYKSKFGRNALRLFISVAVVIILFFFENIKAIGGHYPDAIDPEYYPTVYVMVGLQILFIGFAAMFDRMVKGIKAIKNRKPIPESYLIVLFIFTVIYSVGICLFVPGSTIVTFFFPTSISLLMCAVNERLDLHREAMSFKIVSSKMPKFAFEKLDIGDAELETKAFNEFLPKQPSIFKINKTDFIDGYFRRTNTYPSLKLVLKAFIPATSVISVIAFIAGMAIYKDWQRATVLSYLIFSFAAPASVYLSFGLPIFKASKVAYAEKSAIIGEAALDEYTTAASISFDDREVFPTSGIKLKSVKVFGSGRIDNVVYYVSSIYTSLGGPFADILKVATADLDHSDNVEILGVENEGVEALVDGRHLYAGRADYLLKNNYTPVTDPDDDDIESEGEISIMFLVCDDEVIAKLYVRYRIDQSFEKTLKRLYKSGICVGIKTIDPNINDEMLSTKIKLTKYPVRVLKYAEIAETRHGSEHTDSGIVSRRSAQSLLNAFTLCDKVKHASRTNIMVNSINIAVGLVISVMIAIFGTAAAVNSIYIALFQIFWIIPMLLMAKFML